MTVEEKRSRNEEIRRNFEILQKQGRTVSDICETIARAYLLQPDTVRKIYYDTNYETRYKEKASETS